MSARGPANPPPASRGRQAAPDGAAPASGDRYPEYVLGVLVLVYVFNFLDRQILSILNEHIKADLGVSDAEMGFLFGTAFAVFYALFGIPLGRLADVWVRRSLIALGLAFWSAMTALSGLARSFSEMAAARIGVGIGEASASPAAYSMLSDYFPPARRATVLAIYSSGIYIGAGLGLMVGGQIVDRWDQAFATAAAPFGLRGWQVAFFAVGLPGILLSIWVRTLREPRRDQQSAPAAGDETARPSESPPLSVFLAELGAVLPPLTFATMAREGGRRALATNVAAAGVATLFAWTLTKLTGDAAQWIALGIGCYAAFSWTQALSLRQPEVARALFGTPTLVWAAVGFGFLSFSGYGVSYWVPPYFLRVHGVGAAEVGLYVGGAAAAAGWLGVSMGGALADAWRARSPLGRLYTGMTTALLSLPLLALLLSASSTALAYVVNVPLTFASSMWIGAGIANVHDLVRADRRGIAGAAYLLVVTFVGLALGPYTIGKLSVVFGGLAPALLAGGAIGGGLGLACLVMAALSYPRDRTLE